MANTGEYVDSINEQFDSVEYNINLLFNVNVEI